MSRIYETPSVSPCSSNIISDLLADVNSSDYEIKEEVFSDIWEIERGKDENNN